MSNRRRLAWGIAGSIVIDRIQLPPYLIGANPVQALDHLPRSTGSAFDHTTRRSTVRTLVGPECCRRPNDVHEEFALRVWSLPETNRRRQIYRSTWCEGYRISDERGIRKIPGRKRCAPLSHHRTIRRPNGEDGKPLLQLDPESHHVGQNTGSAMSADMLSHER